MSRGASQHLRQIHQQQQNATQKQKQQQNCSLLRREKTLCENWYKKLLVDQRWVFQQGLRKQKQETTCFRSGVLCETGNRNRDNLRAWSPREAAGGQNSGGKKFVISQRIGERVCWNFGSNFPGTHRLKKHVFRRRNVGDLTKLRSGSQIFDKCEWHVCHDVCGVCGEDWQVGHSEDKSSWRFKLTLYSSSFSLLSSALSIPNSNCSSATCG